MNRMDAEARNLQTNRIKEKILRHFLTRKIKKTYFKFGFKEFEHSEEFPEVIEF